MHELSLTKPIVDLVIEHARANNATRVTHVTLLIGKLYCAQPSTISWCFDAVTKNTLAQNAQLIIEEESGLGYCRDCSHTFELTHTSSPCSQCKGHNIKLLQGQSFMLKSIRVDH